ncbi:MAG: NAD kinase [Bacteroidales bacterium]|nr:NAD kinase [Bacteroidales bacterium]
MKIAIFGIKISPDFQSCIIELFEKLREHKVQIYIFKPFYGYIAKHADCNWFSCNFFSSPEEAPDDIDFLISIGGDGTFLESMRYLKSSKIPVIGLNSGRLGYLANISSDEISHSIDTLFRKDYKIEERTLLRVESNIPLFDGYSFALNEVTIQKSDSSLIAIDTWINDEFINTYWTDGLIIATPTGSTAYALSVGGPIVVPGSGNFILAPIASHNLSVRPMVVPDNVLIKMVVKPRSGSFLVTADNRTMILNMNSAELFVRKSKFRLKMLKLPYNNYYQTLRNKLMWGMDKRN